MNSNISEAHSEKVLEALIRITQERDQESLEVALLQTICEHIESNTLKFYRVTPAHHDDSLLKTAEISGLQHFKENTFHYQLVKLSSDARHALKKHKIVQRKSSTSTLTYIPVLDNNRTIGLLEISSLNPLTPADERFIHSLMQIYPHFLSVVRDNESDSLTGLLNRKTFDEKITQIFHSHVPRYSSPKKKGSNRRDRDEGLHWLGVLDIDHFKKINDKYGHLYGDEVLILLASIMRENFRENDLLYRYGGEEFVIVLSPCSANDAITAFERLRTRVENYHFSQVGSVTISIGFVKFGNQDFPTTVVNHADQALYYAKKHGRNRICSYEELRSSGEIKGPVPPSSDIEIF